MSQQNKSTLQSAINTQIADNNTGEISAADVRDNLINITDSLLFNNGDPQTLDGSLTVNGSITGSLNGTAVYALNANNAITAFQATLADFVQLTAGPGITLTDGGLTIAANVLTVNGITPNGDGNIPLSLGTVVTGTSASLVISSSGAVTASIQNATVWVVSGDGTPANNGDVYIFKSGSVGQWLVIAPLDEAASDARYARIGVPSVQSLTSSFAVTASSALTASYVKGVNVIGEVANADQANSAYYADGAASVYSEVTSDNFDYYLLFTDDNDDDNTNSYKNSDLTYNPSTKILNVTASHVVGGAGGSPFPYTGNAQIFGNLDVDGVISSNGGVNSQITMVGLNTDQNFDILFSEASTNGGLSYPYYDSTNQTFTFNPFKNQLTVNGAINHGFLNDVASGTFSYAQGFGNVILATANFSHAQGVNALVVGQGSHAEGESNKAIGDYSHAEGFSNIASGSWSHAEGHSTIASGSYSHTEGSGTVTSGSYSHAEGYQTKTIGNYTHAEGRSTIASGSYSHAEGYYTIAFGSYSHAEGYYTTASGGTSHAEGYYTIASGSYSHAEGSGTRAQGIGSHAEGLGTVALGNYQHAQGQYNQSSSIQSAFIIGNGVDNNNRSNLVFASGSKVQITGSLDISGSIGSGQGTIVLPGLLAASYPDDATAAAAGIPVGGLYRNGSTIQIRLV